MKKYFPFLLILSLFCFACTQTGIEYPVTKKVDTTDVYFGIEVPDPYRWLEDDNSEETTEWVKAQNEVTFTYLEKIPFREKIRERLTEIWDYPRYSTPWKQGGYYFFSKNEGLQDQSIYYIQDVLESEPRVIIDPNKLSEDGTVALTGFSASKDGKYLGYGISHAGSDWKEYYVKDIATGNDLDDHIMWVKFQGISWYKNGFFYSRYPEPGEGEELSGTNRNNRVYYHKIGTDQSTDELVYEEPEFPERSFGTEITEDKKYLTLTVIESTSGNALYLRDLNENNSDFVKIVDNFDNDFFVIEHIDGKLLVRTNYNAPMYKVIQIDIENIEKENWKDFIPERENEVLRGVTIGGNKIFARYQKDAYSKMEVFNLHGEFFL
ncbi:Prolyl endopeptidase [subsurface metagenome]